MVPGLPQQQVLRSCAPAGTTAVPVLYVAIGSERSTDSDPHGVRDPAPRHGWPSTHLPREGLDVLLQRSAADDEIVWLDKWSWPLSR